MSFYFVTLRKAGRCRQFYRPAYTAASVYDSVAAEQGDEVFGITVVPA